MYYKSGSHIQATEAIRDRAFWAAPDPDRMDMDALCHEAIAAYRMEFASKNADHPWTRLSDEEFLMRLNAAYRPCGSLQTYPTAAGVLMFGYEHEIAKIFPEYVLDYRLESKSGSVSKRIVSNDGSWSGCIFDFWRQVSPILSEAADDGSSRSGSDDVSLSAAAKEGLANALVHSDYAGRRHLVVVQRADRIEYSNPGDLRVRASIALEGGVSDPRNPYLMKMFALIGVCTDSGRGLNAIVRASEKADVFEPVLSQQADPARTILTIFMPNDRSRLSSSRTASHSEDAIVPLIEDAHARIPADVSGTSEDREVSVPARAFAQTPTGTFTPSSGGMGLFDTGSVEAVSVSAEKVTEARPSFGEPEEAISDAMNKTADPEARAVIALFRDRKRIRRSDVEDLLGVGSTKAKSIVAELVSGGVIVAEGGGRSTLYRLSKPAS